MNWKKIIKIALIIILVILAGVAAFLFVGKMPEQKITWGMNFSQGYAQELGLDWKQTYLALLDDMGVKNVKLAAQWDLLEPQKDQFYFSDLDWQISQADERGVQLIPVIGMKTPRWPECHIPEWAQGLTKQQQQAEILNMLQVVVERYKNSDNIKAWQVENEPLFPFGNCPWIDKNFLKEEIAEVHKLDPSRPIIVSDAGEWSPWISVAPFGDILGTTMYRKVWFSIPNFLGKYLPTKLRKVGFYMSYYFPPVFYGRRAELIKALFHKEVICVELQAEPWTNSPITTVPLSVQAKTMNSEQFEKNIEFAKKTGLSEFYLWGGEWMYWMKTKQNDPAIWNEAKQLFNSQ